MHFEEDLLNCSKQGPRGFKYTTLQFLCLYHNSHASSVLQNDTKFDV